MGELKSYKIMEHKIDEIIPYNFEGETIYLKVTPTKDSSCQDCFFHLKYKFCYNIRNIIGECENEFRTDKTPVIFRKINNKIMKNITLEEARELYKQGSMAKEIALRYFTEKEILNDYSLITSLPKETKCKTTELYAKLKTVYKEMSKGREVHLTKVYAYIPTIIMASNTSEPRTGEFVGKVLIDDKEFCIFITTNSTKWEGRLGYENNGVYCGSDLLENTWVFKEREQAEHFVKFFYKELILLSLVDEHKVTFI